MGFEFISAYCGGLVVPPVMLCFVENELHSLWKRPTYFQIDLLNDEA
jgi:hypothetical protein